VERTRLPGGAWIDEAPEFLSPAEADALQAALRVEVAWETLSTRTRDGREVPQPRLMGWAGELPYRYSGLTLPPRAVTPAVAALWPRVEAAAGCRFNHVVLNRYRDGRDHVAMHADAEPELGRDPVIAAISVGAVRKLVFTPKWSRAQRKWRMPHGGLLVMGGTIQHTWRHGVPVMASIVEERINLTFRWLHGPPGWVDPGGEAPLS
jgi:alkylated DNA repair dioxygenase AlkB